MKLTSAMVGISVALLFWMTAAFIRPVPTDTYEHYSADTEPSLEAAVKIDNPIDEQLEASAAVQ